MACCQLGDELLVGLLQIPSLVEDVFVGHLLHFKAFEGGTDAYQILAALLECLLEFLSRGLHIALNGRVAAEVAQIAPDIGLSEETVKVAPHLLELAVIVEHGHLAVRHASEHGFSALWGIVFALIIEEPAHLQPLGLLVNGLEALVDVLGNFVEVFRFETGRIHLVEGVDAVDVVSSEQGGLFLDKEFLYLGIERIFAIEEESAVLRFKLVPGAERLDVGIGEE